MTAFEQWLTSTTAALAPDPTHAAHCRVVDMSTKCDCGFIPSTIHQRLAIGLCQARALELRTMATEMQVKGLNQSPPGAYLFTRLWDRSHKLEQIGLALCTQYPPSDAAPVEEESGPRLVQ